MNRAAQALVLLLVGGAVLRASLTDLYLRYVKDGLRPFLIVAGVGLVVIAIATLIPEFVKRGATPEPEVGCADAGGHGDGDGDDHGGGHGGGQVHKEPGVSWLMVLPVLALLLVAPPALGSDAASRSGTALDTAARSNYPPLPQGDPVPLRLIEYASRAIYEDGLSLRGRRMELTGFIVVGKDGERYLARMLLSCCAADARPIKIGLDGEQPGLSADTWVRVIGHHSPRVAKDQINGSAIPYLAVESITRIPAPRQQYEPPGIEAADPPE